MQVRKWLHGGGIGKPSEALRDIFSNGKAYSFECATAMMVIYHKAILDHIGDEAFDRLFSEPRNLKFFRWQVEDSDFTEVKRLAHRPSKLMPGSHYYYKKIPMLRRRTLRSGARTLFIWGRNVLRPWDPRGFRYF